MRRIVMLGVLGFALAQGAAPTPAQSQERINPMIPLLEQGLPIFGIQHPAFVAGRGGRGRGADQGQTEPPPQPDLAQVARETVEYSLGDYELSSYSPQNAERFAAYLRAIVAAGGSSRTHPFVAKIPIVHDNEEQAIPRLIEQLNTGLAVIEMQEVETVAEIDRVVSAVRFTSKGGTRPESGYELAAEYWGVSPAEYREKSGVWPLDPNGEVLISTIIESREGVANARAIAAHPAVAVITVGAGTLGGVFSSRDAAGERVRDQAGFDAAVAQVLAACKEFNKSCAYPANNPAEVESLMGQGWNFFIMQRRDQAAFDAVETGYRISGRPRTP